jgi:hypothetical protein
MSSRLPLLAALLVVLVLGGAFVLLDDGGAPESGGRPASRAEAPDLPVMDLPLAADRGADGASGPPLDLTGDAAPLEGLGADPSMSVKGPQPTASITGRLFDGSGSPVADEPVDLIADDDNWQPRLANRTGPDVVDRTRSGRDGRFRLDARAGVMHQLTAGGERHGRKLIEPVLAGDELVITLPPGFSVSGTVVTEETGMPVAGAFAGTVTDDDGLWTLSDDDGHFSVEPVAEGLVTLGGWAPGYDVAVLEDVFAGSSGHLVPLPPGREVLGVVVDAETEQPLVGAEVTLLVTTRSRPMAEPDPLEPFDVLGTEVTVTDELGGFRFASAPSRSFRLEARAEGHSTTIRSRWEKRVLAPDETIHISMLPDRFITGEVFGGDDLALLSGVRMTLTCPDGQLSEGLSEADGTFALPVEAWTGRGPLVVEAVDGAGRYARESLKRQLDRLQLMLTAPLDVVVQVTDDDGPVAGAHVGLTSKGANAALGITDAAGTARVVHRLAGAQVGRAWLNVRHGARASLPVEIDLGGDRPTEPVDVNLDLGTSVAGLVLDAAGSPVPSALVTVSIGGMGRTDAEGRFEISPLDPEAEVFELRAEADGVRPAEAEALPGQRDVVIVVEPEVTWTVHVTDGSTGLPLEDVGGRLQFEIWEDDGANFHNTSERMEASAGLIGAYALDLPGPGRYRVAVGDADRIPVVSLPIDFDGVHEPPPLDVVLFRAAMLELEVLDTFNRPVNGMEVALVEIENDELESSPKKVVKARGKKTIDRRRTGSDGRTRFNLGEGGRVQVLIASNAWALEQPVTVLPGPPTKRTLRVPAGGDLLVEVRDASGNPLDNASVSLRSAGKPRPFDLRRNLRTSRDQGACLFEGLPECSYRVTVSRRGFARYEEEVYVSPGFTRHPVRLGPEGEGGTVTKAGGKSKKSKDKGAGGGGGNRGGGKAKDGR